MQVTCRAGGARLQQASTDTTAKKGVIIMLLSDTHYLLTMMTVNLSCVLLPRLRQCSAPAASSHTSVRSTGMQVYCPEPMANAAHFIFITWWSKR